MKNQKKQVNWREVLEFTDRIMQNEDEEVFELWQKYMRPLYKELDGLPHPAEFKRQFCDHYDRVRGNRMGSSWQTILKESILLSPGVKEWLRQNEDAWVNSFSD